MFLFYLEQVWDETFEAVLDQNLSFPLSQGLESVNLPCFLSGLMNPEF